MENKNNGVPLGKPEDKVENVKAKKKNLKEKKIKERKVRARGVQDKSSQEKAHKNRRKYLKDKKTSDKQKKPPLIERLRLSLALKLSMRTFWRSIAVFFTFNIFVLLLIMTMFVYTVTGNLNKTKVQIDTLTELYSEDVAEDTVMFDPLVVEVSKERMLSDYSVTSWKSLFTEREIPSFLEEYNFQLYHKKSDSFVFTIIPPAINVSEYGAYTVLENGDYLLYSFMPFVNVASLFFVIVLIFEFLSIINGLFTMSRKIKKTLEPIQMLAESVHSLNGYDMDTRLYIPGTQNELVDLVAEINGLLDRIQEAYSAQNRFVSDASHELRTPIAVIQGYADLLNRWGKQDEQTLNEGIAAIQNEARNMKNLVEQLLFLARSDHKTTKLDMTNFELSTLVDEVYNEAKMVDKDHVYSINAGKMVWVVGDINMIKQLIRIFCENARKYTPMGGNVKFEVDEEINSAILIIQDDGIGIAQEDIEHIFERFYRVDKSRARKEGGSGLGLAIADQILRFHKGSVDVISREGLGTRIVVRLPLSNTQIVPVPVNNALPKP